MLDPSGAAVPRAAITLTNDETGAKAVSASNTSGEFTAASLQAGSYTVLIEAGGFRSQRQVKLELASGQRIRLNFTLELGSTSQTLEVTAASPMINSVNAEQRTDLTTTQVRELPLARRDWTNLLNQNTGVTTRGGTVSLNGLASASFRVTVDGTDSASDSEFPSLSMYQDFNFVKGVSLEAIDEVNLVKGIASAEVANTLSGNVNVNTKRGTNEIHGSLFLLNQTENLNARNQFLASKPALVYNQFGGSIGGPIIKNKLFAFGVYEGYRLRGFRPLNGNVPTPEFKAQAIAAQPSYKPFLDLFPAPNTPYAAGARQAFYQGAGSEVGKENHAVARVDYHIKDNLILTSRYTRSRPFRQIPSVAERNFRYWSGETEVGTANLTWTRPNWTTETRFGFNLNTVNRLDNIYALGIPGITGLPFSAAGETYFKEGKSFTVEQVARTTRGRHSLSMGGILGRQNYGRDNVETPEVNYANFDDFLVNLPNRVQVTWGLKSFVAHNYNYGLFLQDDFKVNRRLTVNLGLRWDYYEVPQERDNRIFNRDDPFGFGPFRPPAKAWNAVGTSFGPRVGFAYALDRDNKTVLRGGSGMFQNPRTPFSTIIDLVANAADEPTRVVYSRADVLQYPNLLRYPVVNEKVLPIAKGSQSLISGTVINPRMANPFSYQWTLSLARQITSTLAIESAYVGTRGLNLMLVRVMNQPDRLSGVRPNPRFATFRYRDSDQSNYHSWQTSVRKRFGFGLQANAFYTWSRTMGYSNESDLLLPDAVQDTFNVRNNYGPLNFDTRHRFGMDFVYEIPFSKWAGSSGRTAKLIGDGWQLAGIFTGQTGNPQNIVQPSGLDSSRPDYVSGQRAVLDNATATLNYLNRSAFTPVPLVPVSGLTMRPGTLGRNAVYGLGFWNLDMTAAKAFQFTERMKFQLRLEMLNAANHTNLTGIQTQINQGNFGRFTSTRGARVLQVGGRFTF